MNEQRNIQPGNIIVVCRTPASGKGTQCKLLAAQLGVVHVSIGDIVRENIQSKTPLGIEAEKHVSAGNFVPTDMALSIVTEHMCRPEVVQHGALLDGFPRTAEQARSLSQMFNIEHFIMLEAPDSVCLQRALARCSDPITGAIYNLESMPPPPEVAHRLIRRENDRTPHVIQQRLTVWHDEVDQIIRYFPHQLTRIDATLPPQDVATAIAAALTSAAPGGGGGGGDDDAVFDRISALKGQMFQLEQAQQRRRGRSNPSQAARYQTCAAEMKGLLAIVQQRKQQRSHGGGGLSWPPRSEAGNAAAGVTSNVYGRDGSATTSSYMRTTYGAGAKVEPAAAASGDDGGWGEEDEAAGMVGDGPA